MTSEISFARCGSTMHAMAARKFVGAFVLLVLEFETANACCIEMKDGKSNVLQSGPASTCTENIGSIYINYYI